MTNQTAGSRISPSEAARIAAQAAAQYYDRVHAWRFDPLHHWDQLLLLVVLVLIILILLCYWRAVLRCLYGDDTIRCDRFYLAYWGLLECCGTCDGEWTRCLSNICCACIPDLVGRNLKRVWGERLGIYPIAVRVSNIVVGRLPQDNNSWFARSPDLFVQVIPDELQPKLNTELVSEANIECVQFTCSLTLLLKNNTWENPVRFVVRKMTLTRSKDVAECFICPTRLIKWARENQKVRIQMGGPCRTWDPTCTPWILLDISLPMESTDRSHQGSFFTVISRPVKERVPISLPRIPQAKSRDSVERQGFSPLPVTITTDYKEFDNFRKFKKEFPLKNAKGEIMELQSDGEDSAEIPYRKGYRLLGSSNCTLCWAALLTVAYAMPRLVSSSCFEEYRRLLVTQRYCERHNITFPPEDSMEDSVVELCTTVTHAHMLHTLAVHMLHQGDGRLSAHDLICFPLRQDVVSYCEGEWDNVTKRPRLLGIQCPSQSCRFSEILEKKETSFLDYAFLGLLVVLCFGACICRCLALSRESYERQVHSQELPLHSPRFGTNFRSSTVLKYSK